MQSSLDMIISTSSRISIRASTVIESLSLNRVVQRREHRSSVYAKAGSTCVKKCILFNWKLKHLII